MRPQRQAAVAAKAAIEIITKELEDKPEDIPIAVKTTANGSQEGEAAYDPTQPALLDFKREKKGAQAPSNKKIKKAHNDSLEEDNVSEDPSLVVIENPSLLDRLPAELRRDIIRYFDRDPFTILSLMQVNKHWHSTLTKGERADQDFKRRCLAMGSKHRSPGCTTWHETYLQIVKRKCAVCSTPTMAKLGVLLEKGPKWLKVCEYCQLRNNPYKVITRERAMSEYGIPSSTLDKLKSKYRKIGHREWVQDFLLRTVLIKYRRLQRQKAQKEAQKESEAK